MRWKGRAGVQEHGGAKKKEGVQCPQGNAIEGVCVQVVLLTHHTPYQPVRIGRENLPFFQSMWDTTAGERSQRDSPGHPRARAGAAQLQPTPPRASVMLSGRLPDEPPLSDVARLDAVEHARRWAGSHKGVVKIT